MTKKNRIQRKEKKIETERDSENGEERESDTRERVTDLQREKN